MGRNGNSLDGNGKDGNTNEPFPVISTRFTDPEKMNDWVDHSGTGYLGPIYRNGLKTGKRFMFSCLVKIATRRESSLRFLDNRFK